MFDVKISFIIPLFNEEQLIDSCLNSIEREKAAGDEIIVVDNGSTDQSVKIIRENFDVTLVDKANVTVAAVRNAGVALATGEVLAFIDADCVLCKDWRKYLLKTIERNNIAATGSKVDLPENPHWIERAWYSQKKHSAGPVSYINSGNFVVWKKYFDEVGGFDESLVSGEDAELCWQLIRAGYSIYEDPWIKVSHLGNPKSLKAFYHQQRWHGMGMFGTFKISWFDKPVIMTLAFILSIIGTFVIVVYKPNSWSFFAVMSLCWVPVLTSLYRSFQYSNFGYLPQLVLLYLVYYTARTDALLRLCYSIPFGGLSGRVSK